MDDLFKIPTLLEETIRSLGGTSSKACRDFVCLNARGPEIKRYLGTYLPRSFAEGFKILNALCGNSLVRHQLGRRDPLRILDVGSGIGGYPLGMKWFLKECFPEMRVQVTALEGNATAIDYHQRVYEKVFPVAYELIPHQIKFTHMSFREEILDAVKGKTYQIVCVSKFLKEFLEGLSNDQAEEVITDFIFLAEHLLVDRGYLIISDITSPIRKCDNTSFFPKIITGAMIRYSKEEDSFLRPILPQSCARHYILCSDAATCFVAEHISFRYCQRIESTDIFSAVLSSENWAQEILNTSPMSKCYAISPRNRSGNRNYCFEGRFVCNEDIPPVDNPADPFTLGHGGGF